MSCGGIKTVWTKCLKGHSVRMDRLMNHNIRYQCNQEIKTQDRTFHLKSLRERKERQEARKAEAFGGGSDTDLDEDELTPEEKAKLKQLDDEQPPASAQAQSTQQQQPQAQQPEAAATASALQQQEQQPAWFDQVRERRDDYDGLCGQCEQYDVAFVMYPCLHSSCKQCFTATRCVCCDMLTHDAVPLERIIGSNLCAALL